MSLPIGDPTTSNTITIKLATNNPNNTQNPSKYVLNKSETPVDGEFTIGADEGPSVPFVVFWLRGFGEG